MYSQHSLTPNFFGDTMTQMTACQSVNHIYVAFFITLSIKWLNQSPNVPPHTHTHPLPYLQLLLPGGIFNGVCHIESATVPVFRPRPKRKTLPNVI